MIASDLPDVDLGDSTSDIFTSPVSTEEDTNETIDHPEPTPDANSAETACRYPTRIIVPQHHGVTLAHRLRM